MSIQWAFNSATVMYSGWDEELALWKEFGWRAAEVWDSKLQAKIDSGSTYPQLLRQMQDAGTVPIGVCGGQISAQASPQEWQQEKDNLSRLLHVTREMGAPGLTIIIVGDTGENAEETYCRLVEKLREVAEIAGALQVRVNLEFLGTVPINGTLGSCIELINRVDHPALGVLFDLCHYYVSASHIEELVLLPSEKLFMVHIDDARRRPMEVLQNDERCFPGEGRINVASMIRSLRDVYRYDGYYTVELFDKKIWAMEPREVMTQLARSLRVLEQGIENN